MCRQKQKTEMYEDEYRPNIRYVYFISAQLGNQSLSEIIVWKCG